MTIEQNKITAVALKVFVRIAQAWKLSQREAADLADMSDSMWQRAMAPDITDALTHDQLLRLSAIVGIYAALEQHFSGPLAKAWVTQPNAGPLFQGSRPIDAAIAGGLPQILTIRNYVDALNCGA